MFKVRHLRGKHQLITIAVLFSFATILAADIASYQPEWIRNGFADAGATHEPWIFQVRRNSATFNQWQREIYDYHLSEDFIKSLADAGVTVYHIFCYKGFGFEVEKAHMAEVAKAAAIAHEYGLKVDTYIQWNTLCAETFFAEKPEAQKDKWYQVDVTGKPIMLGYGYQQSFRYRPCFNHDGYINYFKEKILRYAVEVVKTDFIHFDNFDLNRPGEEDHNPATIRAFRKYLSDKYSKVERLERFGFSDMSHIVPPMWNPRNRAVNIRIIQEPVMQEWCDFRCWTMADRLAECAQFVRKLNKEVVIEINPHGLVGENRAWQAGIDHPLLMRFTNVIWTEDGNYPRWVDGVAIGKFRHYKLARTMNNFILTYCKKDQDYAECLGLSRTIGWLGTGLPDNCGQKYLDFWNANRDIYADCAGAEKVAVLRSYSSMAYNCKATHTAVNMAEQALNQGHVPFDIIFDQQLELLSKYSVIVLANQESLSDFALEKLHEFVSEGGAIVSTDDTGKYDNWRRLRKVRGFTKIFGENYDTENSSKKQYHSGRAAYINTLNDSDTKRLWKKPVNYDEFIDSVLWAADNSLPLTVDAPQWIGVSHDRTEQRDIVHLFNYSDAPVDTVTLTLKGKFKRAWAISPDTDERLDLKLNLVKDKTDISIPGVQVYQIVVIEKK